MTKRKDRKSKAESPSKQGNSQRVDEYTFPSEQERLPLHIPGAYQVAMGTGEEIRAWMQGVSPNMRAILVPFPNEESYKMYGPLFWHLAHRLPVIVARVQERKLEELVDALSQWNSQQPRLKRLRTECKAAKT